MSAVMARPTSGPSVAPRVLFLLLKEVEVLCNTSPRSVEAIAEHERLCAFLWLISPRRREVPAAEVLLWLETQGLSLPEIRDSEVLAELQELRSPRAGGDDDGP